jgi:ABC-type transport system involved in multi-copper enzyme maturation permease subunit
MNDPVSPDRTPYLQATRALLVKDCHLFRAPMIALLVVGPGCFIIGLSVVFRERAQEDALDCILNCLVGASAVACMLTSLLASAFGGISIAGERTDRTADFLAMLPVTRTQIILSKWTASLLMLGGSALLYSLVGSISLYIGTIRIRTSPQTIGDQMTPELALNVVCWIGFTLSLFGIAWLLSTFIQSGPIAACISIAASLAAVALLGIILGGNHYIHHGDDEVTRGIALLTLVIGLASLICGALYYRRRIAP